MKFDLGVTVRDRVTGLTGVVLGRTEYLTGCAHLGIASRKTNPDGSLPNWQWVDETRCELVKGKKKFCLSSSEDTFNKGGPAPNAPEM